jgi:chondroitin sulfate proteoglycan 4
MISKEKSSLGQTFTQLDVDRGFITYAHDHSDTHYDSFGVAIFLEGDKSETYNDGKGRIGDVLLYDGLWNVTILPINDQPFRLLTDNPGITVVQRQSKAISANMLFTEDPDTPAYQIKYDIMKAPAYGQLVFKDNITATVVKFNQADINSNRVIFVHEEGGPSTDFYFRVSDGKYTPVYRHFRIHVIPLELQLVNSSSIEIQQGTRMAYISAANLGAKTNGQRTFTYYNITKAPAGGLIYMNDAPASIFGQTNVDNEEVVYMQSDLTLDKDNFTATVTNQDAILRNLVFQIRVTPLVRRKVAFVCNKVKTALEQKHLDASRLAGLTNSNPVYFLTETPIHGKIMRIVRASNIQKLDKRSLRDKEVWQFTHEDIKNEVVHYVINNDLGGNMGARLNDSFSYRLVAPGVQPANGIFEFSITTRGEATKTVSNPITEDVTGVSNEEGVRSDMVIAISALFILMLILIVVVLIVKCRRVRHAQRTKCTAPNNTKLNGDTTMTVNPGNGAGNPYGTIQRHTMRRPINNGFATLEHPHNTLRYY